MLAQTADLDIWRHPITLLIVGAALTIVGGMAVNYLRKISDTLTVQGTSIADLRREVAVLKGIDETVTRYESERWRSIEKELAAANVAVAALHARVDQVMAQLAAGNPEIRP